MYNCIEYSGERVFTLNQTFYGTFIQAYFQIHKSEVDILRKSMWITSNRVKEFQWEMPDMREESKSLRYRKDWQDYTSYIVTKLGLYK